MPSEGTKGMTDTPRTDAHYKSHPKDMFDHIQLEFARQLERELAEAKANYALAHSELGSYVVLLAEMTKFRDLLANKEMELLKQLTAHKAALEKCEKALLVTWADLDHLNHWMSAPCRELYMEAKLEIAKLKGNK